MKTKKLIAATLAASMAVAALPTVSQAAIVLPPPPAGHVIGGGTSAPWMIFACAGGIIASAMVANYRDNRELTAPEAWTCGLLFWVEPPHKKKHH